MTGDVPAGGDPSSPPPEEEGGASPQELGVVPPVVPPGVLVLDPDHPPSLQDIQDKMVDGILTVTTRDQLQRATDKRWPLLHYTVWDPMAARLDIALPEPPMMSLKLPPEIQDRLAEGRRLLHIEAMDQSSYRMLWSAPNSEVAAVMAEQSTTIRPRTEVGDGTSERLKVIAIKRESAEAFDTETREVVQICFSCEKRACSVCSGEVKEYLACGCSLIGHPRKTPPPSSEINAG